MPDFLFLTHHLAGGSNPEDRDPDWGPYLAGLRATGRFRGGSAIGDGMCVRKSGCAPAVTSHLSGFVRVSASDLKEARMLIPGNPIFESGGTVEIRELPRTDCDSEVPPHARDQLASPDYKIGQGAMGDERLFQNKNIDDAIIRDCSMVRSAFDDVDLSEAVFTNINLRGATLDNVNLAGVAINDANIEGLTIFGHDIQALVRAEVARLNEGGR